MELRGYWPSEPLRLAATSGQLRSLARSSGRADGVPRGAPRAAYVRRLAISEPPRGARTLRRGARRGSKVCPISTQLRENEGASTMERRLSHFGGVSRKGLLGLSWGRNRRSIVSVQKVVTVERRLSDRVNGDSRGSSVRRHDTTPAFIPRTSYRSLKKNCRRSIVEGNGRNVTIAILGPFLGKGRQRLNADFFLRWA